MANHRIILGDSRRLSMVDDQSVQLVVTSPPYWQLKDYGHEEQIGFYDSYSDYINNLNLVWSECNRVLSPGCRMCINIGDQFARSVVYGRYKIISIQSEIIRFCETIGLDYMGTIIWQKVTTMNTTGGAVIMGSFPYPRNGIVKLDYEHILLFKKQGKAPTPTKEIKEASKMTTEEWNQYFYGHWNFPGERQVAHMAAFPVELPRRLIKMFTFVGDTVLDPFGGSGTTAVAAEELGRNSVLYEINEEYARIASERLPIDVVEYRADLKKPDVANAMKRLPYLFTDPHSMDSKVDPREMWFGSVVSAEDKVRKAVRSRSPSGAVKVNRTRKDC